MLEFHPVAEIFPLMEGEQYDQLVQDIRENGLRQAVWLYEGKIIDGRNRYRACLDAGVALQWHEWHGEGSLVQFVVSLNLHRRHLTSSQRAASAAEALEQLKVEAKERQARGGREKVVQKIGEASKHEGEATHQAAKMFGTNRTYVTEAAKLKDEDDSAFRAIMKGDLTLSESSLINEYLSHSTEADRIASLELDIPDRVILARLAKYGNRSASIKRALDLLEAGPGRTIKQVAKQVRSEITRDKKAQQQKNEEREKRNAERDEREWQEREPFEHFAGYLVDELRTPTGYAYFVESPEDYERLIRHMKNCKLTKLATALEKKKAAWDAEDEQISA